MQTKGRQSGQYGFLTNRSAKWHGLGPFSFFIGSPVVDASECGCVIIFGHRLTGPLGLLVSSDCCHYYCLLLLDFWLARTHVGINRHSQASDPVVPPINIESKLFCRLFYFSISSRVKVPLFVCIWWSTYTHNARESALVFLRATWVLFHFLPPLTKKNQRVVVVVRIWLYDRWSRSGVCVYVQPIAPDV